MISRDVREGVVTRLEAAGLDVDVWRANNVQIADELPLVIVTTPGQQDAIEGSGTINAKVRVDVQIEIVAEGGNDLQAAESAEDVEDAVKWALFSDPTFLDLFEGVSNIATQRGGSVEGRAHASGTLITFTVTSTVSYTEPLNEFGDFDKIDILNEVGGDDTPDIERMVELT